MPFPFAPEHYETQLAEKVERLKTLFAGIELPEPEVFRSEPSHYRMRAEFKFWHDGDD
ncbi:MAG: tRNA (uridine(54)-C5)-methyltransferase TrmA, partial [Saccharospirillum sp.]